MPGRHDRHARVWPEVVAGQHRGTERGVRPQVRAPGRHLAVVRVGGQHRLLARGGRGDLGEPALPGALLVGGGGRAALLANPCNERGGPGCDTGRRARGRLGSTRGPRTRQRDHGQVDRGGGVGRAEVEHLPPDRADRLGQGVPADRQAPGVGVEVHAGGRRGPAGLQAEHVAECERVARREPAQIGPRRGAWSIRAVPDRPEEGAAGHPVLVLLPDHRAVQIPEGQVQEGVQSGRVGQPGRQRPLPHFVPRSQRERRGERRPEVLAADLHHEGSVADQHVGAVVGEEVAFEQGGAAAGGDQGQGGRRGS